MVVITRRGCTFLSAVGQFCATEDSALHILKKFINQLLSTYEIVCKHTHNESINQSCIFRVVQVTKSLQDPLEVGNNLPGISDNVRE